MPVQRISFTVPGQGLHEITAEVRRTVEASAPETGLCTLFLQHTSASLVIQENADPSARRDLVGAAEEAHEGGEEDAEGEDG